MLRPFFGSRAQYIFGTICKAAEELLEALDEMIVEKNYLPEQFFSMNETSLPKSLKFPYLVVMYRSLC
jgi:hypothetical protein